jgi:hypothetical protein
LPIVLLLGITTKRIYQEDKPCFQLVSTLFLVHRSSAHPVPRRFAEPLQNNLAIFTHFVTAPYAVPGMYLAMLFFDNGLSQ